MPSAAPSRQGSDLIIRGTAYDPAALAPERALVLEVIVSPKNFVNAAKRVGLEWLAEEMAVLHGVSDYFDPAASIDDDDDEEDDAEDEDDNDFDALLGGGAAAAPR